MCAESDAGYGGAGRAEAPCTLKVTRGFEHYRRVQPKDSGCVRALSVEMCREPDASHRCDIEGERR